MFHGLPYSYRAVRSAFRWLAATTRSFFTGIVIKRVWSSAYPTTRLCFMTLGSRRTHKLNNNGDQIAPCRTPAEYGRDQMSQMS